MASIEFFQESDVRAIAAMVIVRQISVQNRKRRGNGDPSRKWVASSRMSRPRLVGVKTQWLRLVLKHRKEPYDHPGVVLD